MNKWVCPEEQTLFSEMHFQGVADASGSAIYSFPAVASRAGRSRDTRASWLGQRPR